MCLQDVDYPISIEPLSPFGGPRAGLPVVRDVAFRDVDAVAPTEHFGQGATGGIYTHRLLADARRGFCNHLTLRNVVFDDLPGGGSSLGVVVAWGNDLWIRDNIYPRLLGHLDRKEQPKGVFVRDNRNRAKAGRSDPALAFPCLADRWSFLVGDLYATWPGARGGGGGTTMTVAAGDDVTLNAVLQPAMLQTTWFHPDYLGYEPGLLAIGAPLLTEPVEFHEGETLVGRARLSANGTLATATACGIAPGVRIFRARCPGDRHYEPFVFGAVIVTVK